jgi:hypothetical protein
MKGLHSPLGDKFQGGVTGHSGGVRLPLDGSRHDGPLHQSRHGGCELGGFLPDRLFDESPQDVAGGSLEDQSATRGSDASTRDVSFVSSLLRFQLREKVPGGCLEPTEILERSRDQHRAFERREE